MIGDIIDYLTPNKQPRPCPECGTTEHDGVFDHLAEEHPDSMIVPNYSFEEGLGGSNE